MTSAAIRQKRYRARRCLGARVARVEVQRDVLDALVANDLLRENEESNPEKLSAAIEKLLDCWARETLGRH